MIKIVIFCFFISISLSCKDKDIRYLYVDVDNGMSCIDRECWRLKKAEDIFTIDINSVTDIKVCNKICPSCCSDKQRKKIISSVELNIYRSAKLNAGVEENDSYLVEVYKIASLSEDYTSLGYFKYIIDYDSGCRYVFDRVKDKLLVGRNDYEIFKTLIQMTNEEDVPLIMKDTVGLSDDCKNYLLLNVELKYK